MHLLRKLYKAVMENRTADTSHTVDDWAIRREAEDRLRVLERLAYLRTVSAVYDRRGEAPAEEENAPDDTTRIIQDRVACDVDVVYDHTSNDARERLLGLYSGAALW